MSEDTQQQSFELEQIHAAISQPYPADPSIATADGSNHDLETGRDGSTANEIERTRNESETENKSRPWHIRWSLRWNWATAISILTLIVTVIFGISSWVGQYYASRIGYAGNDIAMYSLCTDHEELQNTSICQNIITKSPWSLAMPPGFKPAGTIYRADYGCVPLPEDLKEKLRLEDSYKSFRAAVSLMSLVLALASNSRMRNMVFRVVMWKNLMFLCGLGILLFAVIVLDLYPAARDVDWPLRHV